MADEKGSGFDAVEEGPRPAEAEGTRALATSGREDEHPTVKALRERYRDAVLHHEVSAGDEHVVYLEPSRNREILQWLRDDDAHRYDLLRDVTAVDYGGGRPLQVVYQLFSLPHRRALRVKCELPLSSLEIQSVAPLWHSANWLEREVYDLFGIEFTGHPDLRRILMPENYAEGHPLRKDFPLRGRFSRAEQTRRALSQNPEDYYIPSEMEFGRPQRAEGVPAGRPDLPSKNAKEPGGPGTRS